MSVLDKQARLTSSEFNQIREYAESQEQLKSNRISYLQFRQQKFLEYAQKMRDLETVEETYSTMDSQPEIAGVEDIKVINPYTDPEVSVAVDRMLKPTVPVLEAEQRRLAYEIRRAYDRQYQLGLRIQQYQNLSETIEKESGQATSVRGGFVEE